MKDNAGCADAYRCFVHQLSGRVRSRYHPEYAGWLRQSAGYQSEVRRLPEMIVRAETVADVSETVRFAERYRHPLSVKAGEYRYGNDLVRDNSIFLDISALRALDIDADNALAMVEPGVSCRELNRCLEKQGLFFPIGHEEESMIGGFLLAGGMGSHSPAWGRMSALNIVAVDLVMADGQLHHASQSENPALFWAVQGRGPGAFFVVVRFYLKCYPLPCASVNPAYPPPYNALELLLDIIEGESWDTRLQMMIALSRQEENGPQTFTLNTIAFAQSEAEGEALQTALIQNIPANLLTVLATATHGKAGKVYQRYAKMQASPRLRSDRIITHRIRQVATILDACLSVQPAKEGMTVLVWRGKQAFPDAASAEQGLFFVSTHLQWNSVQADEDNRRWLLGLYDRLAALAGERETEEQARALGGSGNIAVGEISEGRRGLSVLSRHFR